MLFLEEPLYTAGSTPHLQIDSADSVDVVVPQLPDGMSESESDAALRSLLDALIDRAGMSEFVSWYYTPMALDFSAHLAPLAVIYDCMDELSAFRGAPAAIQKRETALLARADLVLTGGQSLYEAKRHKHSNIHAVPSSVDAAHFAQARRMSADPLDQALIPHPRLGYFGVIDERMDLGLVRGVAAARPDWHLVMVGPVVKIDPATLPQGPNIHYLGSKRYADLPRYIAGWDVALILFARNEATRFISPTKTPEYLAAGKAVVSTSIRDVVRPYQRMGLVRIADDVPSFVSACIGAMEEDGVARITRADAFLQQTSWDGTWSRIKRLIDDVLPASVPHASTDLSDGPAAL